ncbi:MAG: DUF434 domain-containing protein [Bacteroidales bacterium]|nr:DUF434 domain-containing protein [Bacteroidales bacterium]
MQPVFDADGTFVCACRDYFYLIDRNYPERGTLKLIGDRYRLSGDLRTVLYRGISSQEKSVIRSMLLVHEIEGKCLMIDGYNVLFSLLNYRLGRIMFIGTDNILRDAGALHGKIRNEVLFKECVLLWTGYLRDHMPESLEVFLDAPVSHSEKHARMIRDLMAEHRLKGDCHVVRSADWALKQFRDGIIATSDTAIIDNAGIPVFDLPRNILESNFQADFIKLKDCLTG